VTRKWGDAKRNAWLRGIAADGKTLNEATQSALGMSFEELDRQWREEIAKTIKAAESPDGTTGDDKAGKP